MKLKHEHFHANKTLLWGAEIAEIEHVVGRPVDGRSSGSGQFLYNKCQELHSNGFNSATER